MSLQDTDLLYLDRGGVQYQVTWADIKTRTILATDQFLIQRGFTYYRVPIGDFWTCAEVSTQQDYYLIERNGNLLHETIIFPCEVQIDISGATSTVVYMSGGPDPVTGDSPYIQNPDGTRIILTTTPTAINLTQNGSYLIGGNVTQFQIQSSDGSVDASPTGANVWANVFASVPNFGEKLFNNINLLTGIPAGLVLDSLDRTFEGTNPDTTDLGSLDVSAVTSAVGTFLNSAIDPSDDISTWDVSNVTNMSRMFEGSEFFDVDISGWDIAAVTDMSSFLNGATRFDQDLSPWAVPIIGVTNMASMFENASTFNQDLSTWDVSTMVDASSMFKGASNFNQDLGDWDVTEMRTADSMFENAVQFNQDLTEWCVNTIPTEPTTFKTGSSLSAANSPSWGTCPKPQCGEMYYIGGGSPLRITGTTTQAAPLTDARGLVSTVGPGNFSYATSITGTIILPVDYLTKLSFSGNASQQFDFASCFYTGNITDMTDMFNGCKLFNGDIANWDTSKVTSTFRMFENAQDFNSDISTWDLSSNTDARRMFMNAHDFNQDISSWDMSKVLYAQNFFRNASSFNQNLSSWDFSSALNLGEFFWNAIAFNGDISGWTVSNTANFLRMFNNARVFNGDISAWDTANASNMQDMFRGASAFNGVIGGWETGNVTDMIGMFRTAAAFNQDLNTWNVAKVTNMSNMFHNARAFNQSLNDWDTSGVPAKNGMYNMFQNAISMQGDISEWCVANITSEPTYFDKDAGFEDNVALLPTWGDCPVSAPTGLIINNFNGDELWIGMYFSAGTRTIIQPDGTTLSVQSNRMTKLTQLGRYELPMGAMNRIIFNGRNSTLTTPYNVDYTFDTGFYSGSLTNMYQTFRNAKGFNGNISGWDVSKVINMSATFMDAAIFNDDISAWDVSNATNLSAMFNNANAFDADISEWDTEKTKSMSIMFQNAYAFNQDLSLWNLSNVTNTASMFENAATFDQYLNPWDVSNVTNMREMFRNATAMQGDISNWCVSQFSSEPTDFDTGAGFEGDTTLLPTWGECTPFNGIYLKELVGGVGDFVIGGVAADNTVQIRKPDGTFTNPGTGTFANKYTQLGWYEIQNMEKLTGLRFFDNDILFDDTSETADFYFSSTFDTSGLTESRQMFREALTFKGDISMFDLSNVTNMAAMFRNAAAFSGDVTGFPTENVTNMSNMFRGAISVNQDISVWSVYNVTSMSDMFRDAIAFDQDLSEWCVPLISSLPSDFATGSPLAADVAKQPGWGTCPNQITIVTPPVIANENGTVPAPYSEAVVITTDAVTSPAGATPSAYQWQTSADDVTWVDVDVSKNVGNQATYTPNGHDRDQFIRVNVSYGAPGVPDTISSSNSIRVEDTDPPLQGLYTTTSLRDYPLGLELVDDSVYGLQRVCLTAADGNFYAYPFDGADILTIWSPVTGDYVEFRDLDYEGAGINADSSWNKQYWDGGIAVLGETKHLLMPDYVKHFWMYDYVANTWEMINSSQIGGLNKFSGAVYSSVTGKYYSVPRKEDGDIFEIDTSTKTATMVFNNGVAKYGFSTAAEGPDGKIYFFPNYQSTGPHFVQFDPTTGAMVQLVSPVGNTDMWNGVRYQVYSAAIYSATSNTMIACPCNANSFIKLDFNNMVGGLPAISAVAQTVDTRTSADGTTKGKWHAMVLREDGRFQCCAAGQFNTGTKTSRNAIYDPVTDTCIDDGPATVGAESNNIFVGGVMTTTGRTGSPIAQYISGSGGPADRVWSNAMWDSFSPITTYDPNHPKYNYNN